MSNYSYVFNAHPTFIDSMYQKYLENPDGVENGWRTFFEGFEFASSIKPDGSIQLNEETVMSLKELQVVGLINGYRRRGHLLSTTNPIRAREDRNPMLSLSDFGLSNDDLKIKFKAGREIGLGEVTLQEIIDRLKHIYCRNIGLEYFYIDDKPKRRWLRQRLESFNDTNADYGLSIDKKKRILEKLNGAVGFEAFLHKKYIAQKRFSLEGGENTIPALDAIINKAGELGAEEIVIGMAHRGRLNVLANIMGKTYEHIFNEFEGKSVPDQVLGDGDVKYHMGYSSLVNTPSGKKVNLKLIPNPSHLEAVNPVVEGYTRAKSDILYKGDKSKMLPVLIHGDAALAGQGIVYEVIQMSKLDGYSTGGTVHFVINNQVGFTTDYKDGRSSTYCTGVASVVQAPVIHVNGDDAEAVVFAAELATEYRNTFSCDVFIDMVCYRKHGHNEGDDPSFTQPELYKAIGVHKDPRELYAEELISKGEVEAEMVKKLDQEFNDYLQDRLDKIKEKPLPYSYQEPELAWKALKKNATLEDFKKSPDTAITEKELNHIIKHLMTIPEGFTPLNKMDRLFKGTSAKLENKQLDWQMAELSAYASILMSGADVRLSGQDVKRGTFSHRHAVLKDDVTYKELNRLDGISPNQGKFHIYNSLLSEYAVLGFEYGYSLASPDNLILWEAQFGDFANGAHTIIDQFIVSGESKWLRQSGIVMLLPHGYEGQGPEHSSARLERFLLMCAEQNITVANITSPSNYFHALRRQVSRPFRKPMIVMSPKQGLRHEYAISDFSEFTKGGFREVIDDAVTSKNKTAISKVKKVVLCSGKLYLELRKKQEEEQRFDVALVRIEQLYPYPKTQVDAILAQYAGAEVIWIQEEPENMGAWRFLLAIDPLYRTLDPVYRKAAASPATGFKKIHDIEQEKLIQRAFEIK